MEVMEGKNNIGEDRFGCRDKPQPTSDKAKIRETG
jgi:hypothetical protein